MSANATLSLIWTELQIQLQTSSSQGTATHVGLHALGINIHRASVDGLPAAFSYEDPQLDHTALSQIQINQTDTKLGNKAGCVSEAAEKAYWAYLASVSQDRKPTLYLQISKSSHSTAEAPPAAAELHQVAQPPTTQGEAVTSETILQTEGNVQYDTDVVMHDVPPSSEPGGAADGKPSASLGTPFYDTVEGVTSVAPLTEQQPTPSSQLPPSQQVAQQPQIVPPAPAATTHSTLTLRIHFSYLISHNGLSETSFNNHPRSQQLHHQKLSPGMVISGDFLSTVHSTSAGLSSRHARSLFPCLDTHGSHHTFDLHFLVRPEDGVVCCGSLVSQTLVMVPGVEAPVARRLHFALRIPVLPAAVAFAAGPFQALQQYRPASAQTQARQILSDFLSDVDNSVLQRQAKQQDQTHITHLGPQHRLPAIANTSRPLYLPFEEYERYLGTPFPLPQLHFAYVPFECQAVDTQIGAGVVLVREDVICEDGEVEAAMESRVLLAAALARQWFGVLLLPRSTQDQWIIDGLSAHLEDIFVKKFLGINEVAYRRYKEREAVVMADDGKLPPLCLRSAARGSNGGAGGGAEADSQYGSTYGTEALDPGPIRRWKAAAVMRMLEQKAGEDQFQRLLSSIVSKAVASMQLLTDGDSTALQQGLSGLGQQVQEGHNAAGNKGIVVPAAAAAGEAVGQAASMEPRLLSTPHFLELVGKLGGFKKGIQAFAERWIYGSGCPQLVLERRYIRSRNVLELRISQNSSPACRKGAERAAKKHQGSADDSHSTVKVLIHETDHLTEVIVKVGPGDKVVEQAVELVSKPTGTGGTTGGGREGAGGRGRGRGGSKGGGRGSRVGGRGGGRKGNKDSSSQQQADEEGGDEGGGHGEEQGMDASAASIAAAAEVGVGTGAAANAAAVKEPVLYIRMDPRMEWLCSVTVKQDATMWETQLEKSRDVVAQSQAVAGLAPFCRSEEGWQQGAISALGACLKNRQMYCRIRMEAAMMLGVVTSDLDGLEGLRILSSYFREHALDPATLQLRPNLFADLAEHLVVQTVPVASAQALNIMGETDQNVLDLIRNFLDHCDNTSNSFSDANLVASFVEALGYLRVPSHSGLVGVMRMIERHLVLEEISPSPRHIIASSCLRALANLAGALRQDEGRFEAVKEVLKSYWQQGRPSLLRRVAARCLLEMFAAQEDLPSFFQTTLDLYWKERSQALRVQVLEDAFGLLGKFEALPSGLSSATVEHIRHLYSLMCSTQDSGCRHTAFVLLMRLAGQAPTLYRESEDEDMANSPVMPEATGAGRRSHAVRQARSSGQVPSPPAVKIGVLKLHRPVTATHSSLGGGGGAGDGPSLSGYTQHQEQVPSSLLLASGEHGGVTAGCDREEITGGAGDAGAESPTRSMMTQHNSFHTYHTNQQEDGGEVMGSQRVGTATVAESTLTSPAVAMQASQAFEVLTNATTGDQLQLSSFSSGIFLQPQSAPSALLGRSPPRDPRRSFPPPTANPDPSNWQEAACALAGDGLMLSSYADAVDIQAQEAGVEVGSNLALVIEGRNNLDILCAGGVAVTVPSTMPCSELSADTVSAAFCVEGTNHGSAAVTSALEVTQPCSGIAISVPSSPLPPQSTTTTTQDSIVPTHQGSAALPAAKKTVKSFTSDSDSATEHGSSGTRSILHQRSAGAAGAPSQQPAGILDGTGAASAADIVLQTSSISHQQGITNDDCSQAALSGPASGAVGTGAANDEQNNKGVKRSRVSIKKPPDSAQL
ncbi:hypothetical protein CEUSTIGMA_g1148.t1 [Chlamydomonas eustigma]|uniref:Transcription initiation factor TFIID subunit 2 n=1 Tax=Chlamydomonas eustigma TaxID=1157962 RepID=A0A250WSI0_9CHLO|nr:hypothetical protein CEUSTIGMA_g1148.t1 [Chlamydomonas eustigma]|eukprot:GAX73696.1 hypothetical protein CEUSTIGMA_g1148.t1 [Chlamydomonas eustigma]